MSANNFIRIQRIGKKYHIDECDADTKQSYMNIGKATSFNRAVEMAHDYEQKQNDKGYEIEYGIKIER